MVIDWTRIHKKYKGLWIALKEDERGVLAWGKTAKEAWGKAQLKGYKRPILTRMPDELLTYVGFGL